MLFYLKRKAFGTSPGLDIFRKICFMNLKTPIRKQGACSRTACMDDHIPANYHSITDKPESLSGWDADRVRNILLDHFLCVPVKSARKVECGLSVQRRKACVKVIEPFVHKFQGENLNP